MTTKPLTNSRIAEIQAIWEQYQGLYVIGGVLIGLLLFPFLELLIGLVPEAIGIGFTVFFLDRIYQRRETEALKKRLVREVSSRANNTAVSAVDWMRHEGWLTGDDGLLKEAKLWYANLKEANLRDANLENVDLYSSNLENSNLWRANLKGIKLSHSNLQKSELVNAMLKGAEIYNANLKDANLHVAVLEDAYLVRSNLEGADLVNANLSRADLSSANLAGANLSSANLYNAKLNDANLVDATLPDGSKWNENTDMEHFTDPLHGFSFIEFE